MTQRNTVMLQSNVVPPEPAAMNSAVLTSMVGVAMVADISNTYLHAVRLGNACFANTPESHVAAQLPGISFNSCLSMPQA